MRHIQKLAFDGTAIVVIGHRESDIPDWIENELRLEEGRVTEIVRR